MTEEERILQLRRELHQYNYNYYVKSVSTITDQAFDGLMAELMELERKHPEMGGRQAPERNLLSLRFLGKQHKTELI